jgi:hypothetical protein
MGVVNFPAFNAGTAAFDAQVLSLGGGIQPTERLNLFAYANWFNFNVRGADGLETSIDKAWGKVQSACHTASAPPNRHRSSWGEAWTRQRSMATPHSSISRILEAF